MPQATATTAIEIDTSLLERLRARHPGKADREMIEDIAQIDLGSSMLRQAKERNVLSEAEATELGVLAAHDARHQPR
jgi:16S rRNA A1518/A1519 N6-dimethyltransferase RsmA/KsgA/DIM1 with predicted DNA glycosylase/AP lyase activity